MTAKVLGPRPGKVLGKTSLDVGGNAGIERIVRTEDDIDLPVHVRFIVPSAGPPADFSVPVDQSKVSDR